MVSESTQQHMVQDWRVPVARPKLPAAGALLPFLEKLDQSRTYSNYGPVHRDLQHRLSQCFSLNGGGLALTASGSAALIGAILARAGRPGRRRLAFCASYTFVATLSAIQCCGYEPYLLDVGAHSWALDPIALGHHSRINEVGLVVVTCPYGRVPDFAAWQAFSDRTGIPVVVDAAAAFDTLQRQPGELPPGIPLALSFHATKAFGCGEGGAIFCADPGMLVRAIRATNNGFLGRRAVEGDNINGKMSEYHACVALAELEGWPEKAKACDQVAQNYQRAFRTHRQVRSLWVGGATSYAYALYHADTPEVALRVRAALWDNGIDSRFWYAFGIHGEAGFGPFARDDMPVTDVLSRRLLGLPFYCDLPEAEIEAISGIVARASTPARV